MIILARVRARARAIFVQAVRVIKLINSKGNVRQYLRQLENITYPNFMDWGNLTSIQRCTHWSNGCDLNFHVDQCICLDKTWKFVSKFTQNLNVGEIVISPVDNAPHEWQRKGPQTRTRHVC